MRLAYSLGVIVVVGPVVEDPDSGEAAGADPVVPPVIPEVIHVVGEGPSLALLVPVLVAGQGLVGPVSGGGGLAVGGEHGRPTGRVGGGGDSGQESGNEGLHDCDLVPLATLVVKLLIDSRDDCAVLRRI